VLPVVGQAGALSILAQPIWEPHRRAVPCCVAVKDGKGIGVDILSDLNAAQRQAVTAPDGPVLVLAGPGSGKTRVLTRRAAWLIQERGLPPRRIVAVTFTNKAAREMRSRIESLLGEVLGEGLRGFTLGTFHAICARILRREHTHLPVSANYAIYDSADQRAVMKEVVAVDLNLDEKRYSPDKILARVSSLKNELIVPDDFRPGAYYDEIVSRAYRRYQERLVANDALDFDDLLMQTVLLFRDHPDVLARYQHATDYVLVDEFQDTNSAQYALVRMLSSPRNNLFCVGDEDQSIYRWRGADYRNILRLRNDYPDLTIILLEQNYRSTQTILDASRAVIDKNPQRTPKRLFTETPGTSADITIYEAFDEHDEAQFVVDQLAGMVAQQEVEPGQCAIMYRTNAQSRALEDAFIRAGLPYKLVGATRFYGRREIKDVLAYLRTIHNPDDTVSLLRIINTPPRAIGEKTIQALESWASSEGITPGAALLRLAADPGAGPFSGKARSALAGLGALLDAWRQMREVIPLGDLLKLILDETGYLNYHNDGTEAGQERIDNVLELLNVAREYEDVPLPEFLAEVALVSDVDNLSEEANAATLLTLHAAKGLEFDVVFMVGLEEGILPHSRSQDDPEQMAEERRLMYVGMTRARRKLYLIYTFQRSQWGESVLNIRSRFLDDIPDSLLTMARGATTGVGYRQMTTWGLKAEEPRPVGKQIQFRSGQRVVHPRFGEGIVVESRVSGDDEEVTVVFEASGLKRLMASFANMQALDE